MSLRNVNLNLLPMLQSLLHEQSVSGAAEHLGLTQPAVSAALARLRTTLGDPLLVKVGRTMELTSRARAMIEQVDRACDAIELLWCDVPFDPAIAKRTFVIAGADHGPLVIAPTLLRRLRDEAPGIVPHFIDLNPRHLHRSQDRRIAFILAPRSVFEQFDHDELEVVQPAGREEFVAVLGPHHRFFDREEISPEELDRERFVLFHPGPARAQELSEQVAGHAPGQMVAARFQQFTMLPIIASVAIVPEQVAERMRTVMKLRIVRFGAEAMHTELCLAWSPVHASDPAHRWMRGMIEDAIRAGACPSASAAH